MSVIAIENLSFSYDRDVILENIDLHVEELDFLAIIGPNGGGKSTLLKLILGMNKSKKGSIKVFGKAPAKNLSLIGYVPQNTNVNTDFPIKVIEVVLMGHVGAKNPLFGYGKDEIACAMGALSQVGMQEFSQSKIGSEPTSSIDIKGQKEIYELLKLLNKSITIVVVSHDISVILEYANKVAHINKTLSYHDISDKKKTFHTHNEGEHFCEVELLQMLGSKGCNTCRSSSV